jgi:peptidoglycan-N-acetylglucosamine deacetylase
MGICLFVAKVLLEYGHKDALCEYLCAVYLSKTPPILKAMASQLTWSGPVEVDGQPAVYLTFDDGPHPEITAEVLDVLARNKVPATFFCVGQNAEKHPQIIRRIRDEGHEVGNHTYAHESGWKTSNFQYLKSYARCQELLDTRSFRPPYGRITRSQAAALQDETNIIMWDVLSGDFDENKTADMCFDELLTNTRPGAIVVFHDSVKAADRMLPVLEPYLRWLHKEGYTCRLLPVSS